MERAVALAGVVLIVVAALVMGQVGMSIMPGSTVVAFDPPDASGTPHMQWRWFRALPWPTFPGPIRQTVRVVATDFAFGPSVVRVAGSVSFNLEVVNTGRATHILVIPVLGTTAVVEPGESRIVHVGHAEPGVYEFFCAIPAHREAGMLGRLIVGPGVVARDSH